MLQYLARRLLLLAPVAFLVTVAVFALIHLTPGDPAQIILGEERNPEALAALHHELGLDQPLPVQYLRWVGGVLHGDWGRSIRTRQPVLEVIGDHLPNTLELGFAAVGWSLLLAIPLGTVAAMRRGRAVDYVASGFTTAGISVPNFFLGILLILLLSLGLRLVPPNGFVPFFESAPDNLRRLIMPAIALGTAGAAINMRFTRSAMLEVLRQDYIRTARAKGASWARVISGHALKNALIPVVTVVGIQVGQVIEGAVVTEQVFAWPGVGKLTVDSIFEKDYTLIQGIVLLAALTYMLVNLLVDLLYAYLDPRISYT